MEKEQVLVMENSDIGRLLTLFDHWKSCGNSRKSRSTALWLSVCASKRWDLSARSWVCTVMHFEMCYESASTDPDEGARRRGNEDEVWLSSLCSSPATVEFILRLHIRIAKCHAHLGEHERVRNNFSRMGIGDRRQHRQRRRS
jgi:hypothetical protein